MRWKTKKKKSEEQKFKIGERWIIRRFLWYPQCLDDEWRWLELTWIHQEYRAVAVDLHWVTADEFVETILNSWSE